MAWHSSSQDARSSAKALEWVDTEGNGIDIPI